MNQPGFRILQLRLTGPTKPDATLDFQQGLNVICGPSDTGKTFAFQCIDYMLGGGKPPKTIPEAFGYDTLSLTVQQRTSDSVQVLQRNINGGGFLLSDEGQEPIPLKADHDADRSDNISQLLLSMSGLSGKVIRHAKGKTRSLSFRDVCRLILVSEEGVIREQSPIHSGQFVLETAEKSVFRLMLEGTDDASLVLEDVAVPVNRKQRGQVVGEVAERIHSRLNSLGVPEERAAVLRLIEAKEQAQSDARKMLESSASRMDDLQQQRREKWQRLRELQSAADVKQQISLRLGLLERQYESDIDRLRSMIETYGRLRQMPEQPCPTCGADPEHQDSMLRLDQSVVVASNAELNRVAALLSGLQSTIAATTREIATLQTQQTEAAAALSEVDEELAEHLRPAAKKAASALDSISEELNPLRQAIVLLDQLDVLAEIKTGESDKRVKIAPAKGAARPNPVATEELSLLAHRLLTEWHFPDLDRVVFSDSDWDFVISSRPRGSHGKGVRAITHAAFNLALLAYCQDKGLAHPGIFIVDSPLVVYREPDADEQGFAPQVKDSFYRSLAQGFSEDQVIVIENLDPPSGLEKSANIIAFTGTSQGRRGFIPVK